MAASMPIHGLFGGVAAPIAHARKSLSKIIMAPCANGEELVC